MKSFRSMDALSNDFSNLGIFKEMGKVYSNVVLFF